MCELRKKFKGLSINFSITKDSESKNNSSTKGKSDPNKAVIMMRSRVAIYGSLLLLLVNFFAYLFLKHVWVGHPVRIAAIDALYSLINSMIGIILGIGVSTLALDFFSYVKYAQERIKEVMLEKKYLDTLSSDEKRKIIDSLESSLYFKSEPIPSDSLYTNIKSKIIPFLDSNYLDDYFLHIDCEFDGDIIKKRMEHELVIFSVKDDSNYTFPFSIYMDKSDNSSYRITSLKFNGVPVDSFDSKTHVDCSVSTDERNQEVFKNHLEYSFKLKRGPNTISYTSESTVDITDMSYSHNLTMPCKHYVAEISMKDSTYDVRGCGFAIDKKESLKIKYFDRICRVEFTDWTIPGDGVIFVFNKKVSSSDTVKQDAIGSSKEICAAS